MNLEQVFNQQYGGIHKHVPSLYDEYFQEDKPGYKKEHKLYTTYQDLNDAQHNCTFVAGKHEYLPFPRDCRYANKFKNVLGWAYLNDADEEAAE